MAHLAISNREATLKDVLTASATNTIHDGDGEGATATVVERLAVVARPVAPNSASTPPVAQTLSPRSTQTQLVVSRNTTNPSSSRLHAIFYSDGCNWRGMHKRWVPFLVAHRCRIVHGLKVHQMQNPLLQAVSVW